MTVAELVARLSLDDSGFSTGLSGAQSKLKASTVAMGNIMSGLITKGAKMFASFVKTGADFNMEMETLQTSFKTMTGSADKAAEVVTRLKKMGAETPFETADLAKTTQLLMQYGFTADDAISKMTMLGDISQGNAQAMNSIATGYAQMSSAGKVNLQDIKQMINGGFNPLQEIAESTGESMASLYDRISKGTMSVSEITASMERSTSEGGKYFRSMVNQSKTMSGQLSTLQDNWKNLSGGLVEPFTERLSDTILPKLNEKLEELTENLLGANEAGSEAGSDQEQPDVSSQLAQWRTDLIAEWTNGLAEDDETVRTYIERLKGTTQQLKDAISERVKSLSEVGTSSANVAIDQLRGMKKTLEVQEKELEGILSEWAGKVMPPEVEARVIELTNNITNLQTAIANIGSGATEENLAPLDKLAEKFGAFSGSAIDTVLTAITNGVANLQKFSEDFKGLAPVIGAGALAIAAAMFPTITAVTLVSAGLVTMIAKWDELREKLIEVKRQYEKTVESIKKLADPFGILGINADKNAEKGAVKTAENLDGDAAFNYLIDQGLDPTKYGYTPGGQNPQRTDYTLPSLKELVPEGAAESAETLSTSLDGIATAAEGAMTALEAVESAFGLPTPEELGFTEVKTGLEDISEAEQEITGSGIDSLSSSATTATTSVGGLCGALAQAAAYDGTSINIAVNYTTNGSLPNVNFPKRAVGIDYVPYNGYAALLHEGEQVLTKAEARKYRTESGAETGVSINYDRVGASVARAMAGFGININGKTAARLMQLDTQRAQVSYNKSYALGVGK